MKHLSASFAKLLAVATCALTLGSCNRSEYAMLPKSSSYHGVARVAAPVPVEPSTLTAPVAEKSEIAVSSPAVSAPEMATVPAKQAEVAAVSTKSAATTTVVAPQAAPRKLNLVQRLALAKVSKQLRKVASVSQLSQHQPAAKAEKVSGNLRTGLILLLVGLLVGLFNGLIGTIIALIGVIFIVLWLLDSL